FVLLWDGQQFALFPEFPDVKPQEVHPFLDVHDPSFGFTECQASFRKKLLYPWSGIGFQYFPCWGRDHTSSSARGSHPRALTDPDMNLSAHPAPIVQPQAVPPSANAQRGAAAGGPPGRANAWPDADDPSASCISAWPNGPKSGPGLGRSDTAPICSTAHNTAPIRAGWD